VLAALRGPRLFVLAAVASLLVAVAASVGLRAAETPLPRAGLELVAEDLPGALLVTTPPADEHRLFVVQQKGLIRIIKDGKLLARPFLSLRGQVATKVEQGLLGLAFHPDFSKNGLFYIDYTDRTGATHVVEYRVSADPDVADMSTARTLMTYARPSPIHNGGGLAFGPDRMLYIGSGDGGPGADPSNMGQRTDVLFAKLLRIDVDRRENGLPYGIPPDNPFATRAGARPEIWAYGLRNPWRFSFDRATGNIWIGDVGELTREEVDMIPAGVGGLNFGWNQWEGFHPFQSPSGAYAPPYVFPVSDYAHRNRCSVTGGYVYRGTAVPDLRGRYIFGDWCSGEVFWVSASPAPQRPLPVAGLEDVPSALSSFGEDPSGELYLTAAGKVFKIVGPGG
jgi:glucose/arabinose dehydrogenase